VVYSKSKEGLMEQNWRDEVDLRLLARNNESAFKRLYSRYYFLIFSVSLSYTKSIEDAQDVTTFVFGNLWLKRASLNPKLSLKSYLCGIARNASIDLLRKRSPNNENIDPETIDSDTPKLSSSLAYEDLLKALAQLLNSDELYVLLAHSEKRQNFKVIGQTLGISENAASSLYFRAREKACKAMDKDGVLKKDSSLSNRGKKV
jgi:RNA polymerase sigma-70 factor (ECF subfamily)